MIKGLAKQGLWIFLYDGVNATPPSCFITCFGNSSRKASIYLETSIKNVFMLSCFIDEKPQINTETNDCFIDKH